MNPTPQDPRETINEVLKNIHSSLKWYWLVVMGFAMIRAVDEIYVVWFENASLLLSDKIHSSLLFVLVFLPTFVRYYFGDSRYLDEHYIEHRKWRPLKEYFDQIKTKISQRRMFLDIVLLMVIGIIFVFMAKSIDEPKLFFPIYIFLLLVNSIWLAETLRLNPNKPDDPNVKSDKTTAPSFWLMNNLIHSLLMAGLLLGHYLNPDWVMTEIQVYNVLFVLCITNSIFDFMLTKNYYFPVLDEDYDKMLRASSQKNTNN